MFVKIEILVLIVYGYTLCHCFDDQWSIYEKGFTNNNREEIVVANVTVNPNVIPNFPVEKWKTLTIHGRCYTGGITRDGSKLVVLFSSLSKDGLKMDITPKIFDLNVQAFDFEFSHRRKNGNDKVMVVVYIPLKQEFVWYALDDDSLHSVLAWSFRKEISHFNIFKMAKRHVLLVITKSNIGIYSVDIYEINFEALDLWYIQSIPIKYPATSSCLSTVDSVFYLSIPQTPLNQLQMYQSSNTRFTPYQNVSRMNVDQVVCFENGFKSFIAHNGLEAGIFEITEYGLKIEEIVNSNLEGIQFWLPVPVNTYRDETILFCQRKLDHETHSSFDVDVITYNGNRFEEHVDIPCFLYKERFFEYNTLKCLTDHDYEKGMLGSSYISVADHLSLIVPVANSTHLVFDLNVGIKEMQHPAKNDIESYVALQKMLQNMMEKQDKEYTLLIEERQKIINQPLYEKKSQLKTVDHLLKANPSKMFNPKIFKLRDDIEQVIKNIEDLNKQAGDENKFTEKKNKFGRIIFNGPVEIAEELISEKVNSSLISGGNASYLLGDIVRKDQLKSIEGHKSFANLTVKDVSFENVNGISGNTFLTKNSKKIQINGDLVFTNLVEIGNIVITSKLVNGIDYNKWISFDQNIGSLEFKQLKVNHDFYTKILIGEGNIENSQTNLTGDIQYESLFIPGNVTVENLNGYNFEKFLKKLCLKSLKCHVPSLKVNGVVNCRGDTQIQNLNNLKFPDEYVTLESTEKVLNITGYKEFTNTTRGYKIFTESRVNNIDPNKIITRSGQQAVSSNITFDNLEVASVLTVTGNVIGEGMDKFVPNLGLKETSVLKSNVNFLNLEVQGNIIIENSFNNTDFNLYVKDFILKDEENVAVSGIKSFPEGFTALKNLHIDTKMINDISLDSVISKDMTQELQITTILGTVDFDHLYLKGHFGGENINILNETLVKISENQTIDSKLVFIEELNTENLLFEELNELDQAKEQTANENGLQDTEETIFDILDVEVLEVDGNIIGSVDQFDLDDLQENYLNYIKDQIISEPYYIQKLSVDSFKAKNINDISIDKAFSHKEFKDNLTDFLLYREPVIGNLNIEGSLNVKTVNNRSLDQLLENDSWMKMYNSGTFGSLVIDGNVYFETLQIKDLANANFDEYVNTLIFKNETKVNIQNSIVFENGIEVKKIIETQTLNDVALENILRKDGDQILLGQIKIIGDVIVNDDLVVKDMVNNVDVRFILDSMDAKNNFTTITGEVMFQRLAYVNDLIINGTINGRDFDGLKSQFIYKNADITLDKDTYFNETLHVYGNFGITNDINGIMLSDFVSKIVWITHDTDIQGPVRFTYPAECFKSINVNKEFNTQLLFGKNFTEHVNNGVFINKGLVKGLFNFDYITINENLNTKFINNVNMSNIIPLKSDQEIENLEFIDVSMFHDTNVGGKVNGIKLVDELEKTVMTNVAQELVSEVVFLNNVLVEENLIASKINDKSTSKIVTTNTDQNMTAVYYFNTKNLGHGNLIVDGLVNGVNLTFWKNYSVPVNLGNSQNIEKQWTIMNDLNLIGPVSGDGIINGINITNLIKEVQEKENYICDIEKGIFDDYKNLCTDMTYIYKNSKKQIYKFKYFEELQKITFSNHVHYVKYFKEHGRHYLLINDNSCLSHLMQFQQNGFYHIRSVHTGIITQAEVVRDSKDIFLVTIGENHTESVCKIISSTVVWRFINQDLQIWEALDNQESLLQESLIPLTFYGLTRGVVTEFKIDKSSEIGVKIYRKWIINEDNLAFFPRGLKTGLALRTGKNIIFLNRNDPIVEEDFGIDTEAVIRGTFTMNDNYIVPGRMSGVITVTNVGVKRARKTFLAVASHKEAKVEHRLDIIEIYQNPFTGDLFDKIPTYKPSSLTSIEFENGETLLAFIEEKKVLQIYEYKGIEGFKHRSSIRIPASKLIPMELPIGENSNARKVLGIVYKNEMTFLQAVMIGNKIKDDLKCTL